MNVQSLCVFLAVMKLYLCGQTQLRFLLALVNASLQLSPTLASNLTHKIQGTGRNKQWITPAFSAVMNIGYVTYLLCYCLSAVVIA